MVGAIGMKWFKHISVSLDDPFIQDLMDEFGSDGYLVFFGILEMMSREFDIESPGKVTLPLRFCRRKLRLSWRKISTILAFCHKEGRILVSENGNKVTLNCPKLKDLCDNWTKRQLSSNFVDTIEQLSNQSESEEESEIDRSETPPNSGHFSSKAKEYLDQLNSYGKKYESLGFSKIWQTIQQWVNQGVHPGAIIETLEGTLPYFKKGNVDDVQAYLRGVIKTKAQNWREKDFIKDHKERNSFFIDLANKLKIIHEGGGRQ